jgi:uncharacterized lipoprotein YddW (UPF0748 family)|tara:strand:+ start:128 stop:367 length:240 start_codon:yes stop_codon:yes gene_type:complete
MEGKEGVTAAGAPKPEDSKPGDNYKSYVQQGVDEQRYMVPTKNGVIDEIIVQKYKEAHSQAVKDQNDGGAAKTAAEDDK